MFTETEIRNAINLLKGFVESHEYEEPATICMSDGNQVQSNIRADEASSFAWAARLLLDML